MAIDLGVFGAGAPPRTSVGYLDSEIAEEGTKVILSDGEQITWNPPPAKAVMPEWDKIKKIRHYFGRTDYRVWPAWFYHPSEPAQLVRNASEAMGLGIQFRRATFDEKGRYGRDYVWDWEPGCDWRPQPWDAPKFDPHNPGHGKTYIAKAPDPVIAQNALIAELIPTVTAAVVSALQSNGGPQAPANIDAQDWTEFLAFKAWKETQATVESGTQEPDDKKGRRGK